MLSLSYLLAALMPVAHHNETDLAAGRYRLLTALLLITVAFAAILFGWANLSR